jgi:putative ABC transport system permease protein
VIARLEHAPGVLGVSATTYVPMSGNVSMLDVTAGALQGSAWSGFITPNFFTEMGVPIVRGRSFGGRDVTGVPPVAIVNEAFARKAWPDRDALGATLTLKDFADKVETREVVGIVRDFRSSAGDTRIRPEVYIPFAQDPIGFINLIVRGADPADHRLRDAMVSAVAAVDSSQVVDRIATYDQVLADRTATWRFGAWLLGVFAALAVTLAAVGLAASIAWWVSQRTREIGVRMALGADPGQVTRMFMRQAFALTAVGVTFGLGAAAASTRFLQSWLYGVTPLDPITYAACAVSMMLIAALASYLPARRAARIDPLVTLKAE